MEKLHYSITIKAPKEKVWNTMLDKDTYPLWTDVFGPGSHYKGDWSKGSKILFLAPGKDGEMEGMVSRIIENRPYEFISIEHLGMVKGETEITSGDSIDDWAGAHENYTFREENGNTLLLVDMDINDEFKEMFQDMWPKALEKLKKLVEDKVR